MNTIKIRELIEGIKNDIWILQKKDSEKWFFLRKNYSDEEWLKNTEISAFCFVKLLEALAEDESR